MAAFRVGCCILRSNARFGLFKVSNVAGYKSQYNVQHLYPNSNPDFLGNPAVKPVPVSEGEFSGYIPVDKLDIAYSQSIAQTQDPLNMNRRVYSNVEVRFHVASADWLSQTCKDKLLLSLKTTITSDGFLILRSDKTRKQILNQADCIAKLREIIWDAQQDNQQSLDVPTFGQDMDDNDTAAQLEKARKIMLRQKKLKQ